MAYSQKYALVHFVSPITDGTQFHMSDWLLHTTLADTFAIDRRGTNIDAKLAALLAQTTPVTTTALNESILGTAHVVLLDQTPQLEKLHNDIVSLLEENGVAFNNPEFTHGGFIPHSTIQKSGQLQIGDTITIDTISLVDMFPNNDWQQRKVVATFALQK